MALYNSKCNHLASLDLKGLKLNLSIVSTGVEIKRPHSLNLFQSLPWVPQFLRFKRSLVQHCAIFDRSHKIVNAYYGHESH